MTGFGKSVTNFQDKKITIELKSLNGKTADIRFKLNSNFREKELVLRNMIFNHAVRGKIECNIQTQSGSAEDVQINADLFKAYAEKVLGMEKELNINASHDLSSAILRLPNVIISEEPEMSEGTWKAIEAAMTEALNNLRAFRLHEGEAMEADLAARISSIEQLLSQVVNYEEARLEKLRKRMQKHLDEFMGKEKVDKNRYEQEVLYYMEKLDINEEKVRLAQHCTYFMSELSSKEEASGRKLTFIAQEMGREINTLGAKAQHSELQKLVVNMKDELEKIKEQLANIV